MLSLPQDAGGLGRPRGAHRRLSMGVSTCFPRGAASDPPALPAVLSTQSVMGAPLIDPALPVRLENADSSFETHLRRHFLPETSLV